MKIWPLDASRAAARRRYALFVLASGFAAAINLLARALFSNVVSFGWAIMLAYLVGMAVAFGLNRYFVFERSNKPVLHELLWFALVNTLGLLQVWSISIWLAEYVFPRLKFYWHPELVAHALSVLPLLATSYFGHLLLTFARRAATAAQPDGPPLH